MKQGNLQTLDDLNFNNRFTSAPPTAIAAKNNLQAILSDTAPVMGSADAVINVVEFVDFSCPFSKEVSAHLRGVASANPDRVRLMVRNFPLDDLHPTSRLASQAALCANEQGKYWAMYDALFANQKSDGLWSSEDLRRYALGAGVDEKKYDECFSSGRYAKAVQDDRAAGTEAGVTGTPTFFINGYKIEGAIPPEVWNRIVNLTFSLK
jgi:protein-disulfide isomerase